MLRKIRVLVVDDSALVREVLTEGLALDPAIEVVGSAPDAYSARDKIVALKPNVLTLDVEMPRMNGVEFLQKLMPQYPLPTVMVSALTERGAQTTLDALGAGAIDFVTKPKPGGAYGLNDMLIELRAKVKIASTVNVSHWKKNTTDILNRVNLTGDLKNTGEKIIAIGASTGGTEAIKRVISRLPAVSPGVVIVQHMPERFTTTFSARMNDLCAMQVKEAQHCDKVIPGRIFIAPGNKHMEVGRIGGVYQIRLHDGEQVCGHRPSVEVLMHSVAKCAGANAVGVMLTGMGADGAEGMLAMRNAGARTFAQDEKSCIVFGMPKKAYDIGGVESLVDIDKIAGTIIDALSQ